ncbi:hypothetical protein M1P56_09970 [Streptomyces sp. HU2014]|uniref:hypothetical protein n=1 Tax=Streptomyces sp. HU2014 TaxID=2939414 RepID=UPI00200C24EE|nr:hypothetical protein [Streptomyces sp. HU2014]UQI44652.1 hypothetical protein M1P56_09970 [Streptomyces sp. HU2014]
MIAAHAPRAGRRTVGVRITLDLAADLAERVSLDECDRAKLAEPVALLVELGDTVTAGSVRQLSRDLRSRGEIQVVVTRRTRAGQCMAQVMTAATLRAYAAECEQASHLVLLERNLRKAA